MTGQDGLNQDLDDILSAASNPVFAGWFGNFRSYTFPSGELKFLETEETETGVVSWRWLTAGEVTEAIQLAQAARLAYRHDVPQGELNEIIQLGKGEKRQTDRQKAKNALLRCLGYSNRTHPGMF